METEHEETIVEKTVAYVKDMFNAPPYHRHVDSEGMPIMPATAAEAGLASDDDLRPDPDAFPTKSVAEVNDEIVRRENGV
jgi:hypothetical protein